MALLAHADWLLRVVLEVAVACGLVAHFRDAMRQHKLGNNVAARNHALSAMGFFLILTGSLFSVAWLFCATPQFGTFVPFGPLLLAALVTAGFILLATAAILGLINTEPTMAIGQIATEEPTIWPPPPNAA